MLAGNTSSVIYTNSVTGTVGAPLALARFVRFLQVNASRTVVQPMVGIARPAALDSQQLRACVCVCVCVCVCAGELLWRVERPVRHRSAWAWRRVLALAAARSMHAVTPATTPAAAAGGGMGLAVIAGAAVGGLALLAIGVVVLRRRRSVRPPQAPPG